jgi:hypothetical protein
MKKFSLLGEFFSGRGGARTPDLINVSDAL